MLEDKVILIVDDEKELCKVLSWDFEDAGFKVFQAHSGEEALDILRITKIDVLLSDIKMPRVDGVSLIKAIQEERISVKACFLMTGYADYSIAELEGLGMKKLIQKPIDSEDFIDMISKDVFKN